MATLKQSEPQPVGENKNQTATQGDQSEPKKEKDYFEMMEIDKKKLGRISRGINSKSWIIYPDDRFRPKWDLVITV